MPTKYGDIAKAPKGTSLDMPDVWLCRDPFPLGAKIFLPPT